MQKTQVKRFIQALQNSGNVSKSCAIAGISRQTYYNNLYNPDFKSQVKTAKAEYINKQ